MSDPAPIPPGNPLISIWLRPRQTLHYLIEHEPDKYVSVLLMLGGVVRSIDRAQRQHMGDKYSTVSVLLMAFVMGSLFGWLTYYVYAWGMSATGRWLGGRTDAPTFRTVIAWSLVPSICTLLLLVPELLLFGDDVFREVPESGILGISPASLLLSLVQAAMGAWSLTILVTGTALVQDFRGGRALLNVLLPGLLLIGAIVVVGLLFRVLGS